MRGSGFRLTTRSNAIIRRFKFRNGKTSRFSGRSRHFPAEPGATPCPIKIDIGKWEIFLVESIALLPRFPANQERAGENHIASAPANSVAEPPGRIVRSVQVQSRSQVLTKRKR